MLVGRSKGFFGVTGGGRWADTMLEWASAGSRFSPTVCGPWPFPKKIEIVFIGVGARPVQYIYAVCFQLQGAAMYLELCARFSADCFQSIAWVPDACRQTARLPSSAANPADLLLLLRRAFGRGHLQRAGSGSPALGGDPSRFQASSCSPFSLRLHCIISFHTRSDGRNDGAAYSLLCSFVARFC